MKGKPGLLFYCQHSLGMGHLVRSFTLARALLSVFDVTFLSGGLLPSQPAPPRGLHVVELDPLAMGEDKQLTSVLPGHDVDTVKQRRRARIMQCWDEMRPDVLLIELFPFGRRKFADELLPVLDAVRERAPETTVLCSLRDLLVHRGPKQRVHDEWAVGIANGYFHGVLVHSDPAFARLEDSFQPQTPLQPTVEYTGFVIPGGAREQATLDPGQVVISAGSGTVGAPLLDVALEAHPILWQRYHQPMAIIAGPFLPEEDWARLCSSVEGRPGLQLVRSVPGVGPELLQAKASVSQCGYNTAMDIVAAGIPALVVPFMAQNENEQINRARRLEALGLVRVLMPDAVTGQSLAQEIGALLSFRPRPAALQVDGACETARMVARYYRERRAGRPSARLQSDD